MLLPSNGYWSPPLFQLNAGNYMWKQGPFPKLGEDSGGNSPSTDYLFGYWLGRAYGVIGPND